MRVTRDRHFRTYHGTSRLTLCGDMDTLRFQGNDTVVVSAPRVQPFIRLLRGALAGEEGVIGAPFDDPFQRDCLSIGIEGDRITVSDRRIRAGRAEVSTNALIADRDLWTCVYADLLVVRGGTSLEELPIGEMCVPCLFDTPPGNDTLHDLLHATRTTHRTPR